ncbi:MAG: hypothetical protein MAG795_00624 [Candidatus Woesearchaeota archaeon]|nr:hypothetical protein [Candidatus Woesearchaeota archaeon]
MLKTKSMVSTELIIIMSVAMVIFIVVLSGVNKRSAENVLSQRSMDAKLNADKLSSGINSVYLAGPGASMQVNLPSNLLDGTNYSLQINKMHHTVIVVWTSGSDSRQYSSQLVTANISGITSDISYPVNITNQQGVIYIE